MIGQLTDFYAINKSRENAIIVLSISYKEQRYHSYSKLTYNY